MLQAKFAILTGHGTYTTSGTGEVNYLKPSEMKDLVLS